MKGKIILGSLIVLFIALVLTLVVQNVSAANECSTPSCHQKYYDAINAKQHSGSDGCVYCHTTRYYPTHSGYIGYIVNETNTCKQSTCHAATGTRPVSESHGNKYYGPNGKADCTDCHFANTTRAFYWNSSLYEHDHNFTVEYNFYNYNLSGMPLSTNGGVGKGMFPYYTCTLTCHSTYKIENEVIGWNQSKHARSYEGQGDNNSYCAKCKSPTQYNLSVTYSTRFSYNISASDWQGIQCRICHNLHNDTYSGRNAPAFPLAFYNTTATLQSSTGSAVYDQVSNATVLCQNCHSNRNFAGVHKDTVGFDCANCHANTTFNSYTHTFEVKNTISGVEGCAVCHNSADHTWEQTSKHTNVECWACHDQTVIYNATSGNATSPGNTFGIWNDSSTGNWTTYKVGSHGPASWILHNITRSVSCDKCHIGNSTYNGTIGPTLTCSGCHSSYAIAVNSSKHNQTLNASAPACTGCHAGYEPSYGHTTGNKSIIVNMTTCKTCHIDGTALMNNPEKHKSSPIDCTICHFANTTKIFNLNASLFTHDHNLTIERNFYQYSQSGMPLKSNGGVGIGMFPYYTCTVTCHDRYGEQKIDEAAISWNKSAHANSRHGDATYDSKNSCAKCKSPPNYNVSASSGTAIAQADWQGIQCRVCHNLHNRSFSNMSLGFSPKIPIAFYNATATSNKTTNPSGATIYDPVHNATELCENCHTGSTHNSKFEGTHKNVVGFDCADCHLNKTFNKDETHLFEVKNTTTGVTGCEVCHKAEDHTFEFTANHTGKVTCEACHDKTVARNASGYAVNASDEKVKNVSVVYGLYYDATTGLVSSYKDSHGTPATWPLHNISKAVSCDKCHGTLSNATGLLAPTFGAMGCVKCHPSYASAVNNSMHNKTKNVAAPNCIDCHAGYDTQHNGYIGYIVNESNTCTKAACHASSGSAPVNESHGNHYYGPNKADCTQCHFANTTKTFTGFNSSLYTHDHNLTVEYNFYNYNLYGMPLSTNGGVGKGMFPYYTCTLTCHSTYKVEDEAISWSQSAHANSRHGDATYDSKNSCAKCKSPPNYNVSASSGTAIAQADWQGIQCRVCHNLHNDTYSDNGTPPVYIAFYNATATSNKTTNPSGATIYDPVPNATVLCENCHTGSSHDSKYGGFHKINLTFDCADCHANSTFNNATHLFEVKNTTSGATGCEVCHSSAQHNTAFQFTSLHENIVTCEACHDKTVAKNSSDFVVNVSAGMDAGIYKDTSTNKWTTYKVSHGSPATWPLHNISKSIDCNKCHGARSVYSGAIAPNLTSGGTSYYTTDTLVSGYNLILLLLNPNPPLYAGDLLYTSSKGIPGVTKVLKWDSANQTWVGYQYIVPSSGTAFYYGTNSTMDGYKAYFIKGNATTAGKTYTFVGTK